MIRTHPISSLFLFLCFVLTLYLLSFFSSACSLHPHTISGESAYGLLSTEFREKVHAKIASVLDTSSRKTKTEILAHHFIRAGNRERGCELLYAASRAALRVRALKEAFNSIALAIVSAPNDDAKFRYLGFSAVIKRNALNFDTAAKLGLDALELLGDEKWLPKAIPSATLVDMARREWEELTDCPERSLTLLPNSHKEEAIVHATMCWCDGFWKMRPGMIQRLMMYYGFSMASIALGGDLDMITDLMGYRACQLAHKHGMAEAWLRLHCDMCGRARFTRDQATVKVCNKRLTAMRKMDTFTGRERAVASFSPFIF